MPDPVHVTADDREQPSGIPVLLANQPEVELRVERLPAGDYLVDDAVLIERKTAADFAQSLVDGRLFAQASKLAASRYRPAFIVVGRSDEWAALKVPRHALQGALITLMLVFDIPLFRAMDAEEAGRLILYIGQQLTRLRDDTWVTYHPAKARRKNTRQLRLLQNLPGVGPARARALLETFGSVRACLNAPEEELGKVPGIGAKTAHGILDTVRESSARYETVKPDDLPLL